MLATISSMAKGPPILGADTIAARRRVQHVIQYKNDFAVDGADALMVWIVMTWL